MLYYKRRTVLFLWLDGWISGGKVPPSYAWFQFYPCQSGINTYGWLLDVPLRRNHVGETLSLLPDSGGALIASNSVFAGWSDIGTAIWT